VDVAGLVLGKPYNTLIDPIVEPLYRFFVIDRADGPAWLGLAGAIVLFRWTSLRRQAEAGLWLGVLAIFFIWAIGPRLIAFGVHTNLPMPQMLLWFVPIASNARMPSHAMAMAQLAASMLAAMAIALAAARLRPRHWAALIALLAFDAWSVPIATYRLESPPIYAQLAAQPPGAVLELPFGIRDGFGFEGLIDPRVMFHQTLHGKPIAGGYISRLAPSVREQYTKSPAFAALLALSSGGAVPSLPEPAATVAELRSAGIRYVVADGEMLNGPTAAYLDSMALRLLATDGQRRLYALP
jgi:hypothetical protein